MDDSGGNAGLGGAAAAAGSAVVAPPPVPAAAAAVAAAGPADAARGGGRLCVCLRVRPLSRADVAATIRVVDDSSIEVLPPGGGGAPGGRFMFDRVLGPDAGQAEVYAAVAPGLVRDAVVEGKSALLFAFGATGSGKSHSIVGTEGAPGLLPRALKDLFALLGECGGATPDGGTLSADVSFLEVYQDAIFDLLVPPPARGAARKKLDLKEGAGHRVYCKGLVQKPVDGVADALLLLAAGKRTRAVAETLLNSDSSRSHSVFTVTLLRRDPAGAPDRVWAQVCALGRRHRCHRAARAGARVC